MRGLPVVNCVGYIFKDAIYHKVSDKGGFVNFSISCIREDARDGDPNPVCYYRVKYWVKEGSKLPGLLSKGVPVYINGKWEVNRSKDIFYNTLVADRIQLISAKKQQVDAGGDV